MVHNRVLYGVEVGSADDERSLERVLNPRGLSDSDDDIFMTPDTSLDKRLVIRREPLGGNANLAENKRKKTSELDRQLLGSGPTPDPKRGRVEPISPTSPGSTTLTLVSTPAPLSIDNSFDRELVTPGKSAPGSTVQPTAARKDLAKIFAPGGNSKSAAQEDTFQLAAKPTGKARTTTTKVATTAAVGHTTAGSTAVKHTEPVPGDAAATQGSKETAGLTAAVLHTTAGSTAAVGHTTAGLTAVKHTEPVPGDAAATQGSKATAPVDHTTAGSTAAVDHTTAWSTAVNHTEPVPGATTTRGSASRATAAVETAGSTAAVDHTAAGSTAVKRTEPVAGAAATQGSASSSESSQLQGLSIPVDDLTAGETRGVQPNKNQRDTVNEQSMMDTVTKYRVIVAGAIQYGLKEIIDVAPEDWPDAYLIQQIEKLDKLNTELREAVAALSVLDEKNFADRQEKRADEAAEAIQKLLKDSLRLLKLRQDYTKERAREKDDTAAATARIKRTRVETQLPNLLLKVQAMDTQLTDLEQANPNGDRLIEALFDKYKMYTVKVDEYLKDLQSIYQDAVTCGMGREAAQIEEKMQDLKFKRTSTNEALMLLKENSNINTGTGAQRNKLVDPINPTFNGTLSNNSLDL